MINRESGSSLVAVCLLIILLSFGLVGLLSITDSYRVFKKEDITDDREKVIQDALAEFVNQHQRYPCPALLNVDFDQPNFGIEPDATAAVENRMCTGQAFGDPTGEFTVAGRDGELVRVGALPVRTLNLPDEYIADRHGTRFVYAVSEFYADQGNGHSITGGNIFLRDANGNTLNEEDGTGIYALISPRGDDNGAFDKNGNLMSPCAGDGSLSSDNCDFQLAGGDAVFRTTMQKSSSINVANRFTHNLNFAARNCDENRSDPFGDITLIVDTSSSMKRRLPDDQCPEETGGTCTRIEVARWAVRSLVPTMVKMDYADDSVDASNVDSMNISRFHQTRRWEDEPHPTFASIHGDGDWGDIDLDVVFDDPDAGPQSADDFQRIDEALRQSLRSCTSGSTPLGEHIESAVRHTNDQTSSRKNKLVVITDGVHDGLPEYNLNNVKARLEDPMNNLDNTVVDIIDITGSNGTLASQTMNGGEFFSAADPQALIDSLRASLQICGEGGDTGGFTPAQGPFCDCHDSRDWGNGEFECGERPPPWTPPPGWVRPPNPNAGRTSAS